MSDLSELALNAMQPFMGSIVARSVLEGAASRCGFQLHELQAANARCLAEAAERPIRTFVSDAVKADECYSKLREVLGMLSAAPVPERRSSDIITSGGDAITIPIREEYDIVIARSKTKTLCADMGFPLSLQIKVATVVSELARNIVQYVGSGSIDLKSVKGSRHGIEIVAVDQGNGIRDLETILSGEYKSPTGMGMGLCGASRMMHEFEVDTHPGQGTRVMARMYAA